MPFSFKELELPEVILVTPQIFSDGRGFFLETYKQSDFKKNEIDYRFVQDNYSISSRNVLRGLHYQLQPYAQGKLVSVVKGKVWDVAVDIRKTSPTYKQWVGVELDDEERKMLFIPPGFAHGFLALSDEVHFSYKCSAEYHPASERGIRWDDPEINIAWPVKEPLVSQRDARNLFLNEAEVFN